MRHAKSSSHPLAAALRVGLPALMSVVAAVALVACGTGEPAPAVPRLPPAVWTEISPGGSTTCADGSEFSFFVRPGKQNRVLVEFKGGGACWSAATCAQPLSEDGLSGYYADRVSVGPEGLAAAGGIFDDSSASNPFVDWHHVLIPYCTGDLHLGSAIVEYGEGITIRHYGAANARSAIDWVAEGFEAPERLFVTGCSAGAYASIFWTPLLRHLFPGADMAQLGDSGAGVVTSGFLRDGLSQWNVEAALEAAAVPLEPADLYRHDALPHLYAAVGAAHPEIPLAQFNTLFDGVQAYFLAAMLGVEPDFELVLRWSEEMQASLGLLEAEVPSFDSYVASYDFDPARGTPHCVINGSDLYEVTTNGVALVGWLGELARGRHPGTVRPPE